MSSWRQSRSPIGERRRAPRNPERLTPGEGGGSQIKDYVEAAVARRFLNSVGLRRGDGATARPAPIRGPTSAGEAVRFPGRTATRVTVRYGIGTW